jgi:DNA-directed RNA polymerase specialized sigma24 family protein
MEGIKMKEFKIKINNEIISVSEEVYITYYKMARRERYLTEVSLKKDLSYNQLMDKEYPIEAKMIEPQKRIEDEVIEKIMIDKMTRAIKNLTDNERIIINELFFDGKSERELANLMKIPRTTLHSKKIKIISKLKNFIQK